MPNLSIGLIGAGAVGSFYAGHMAKHGADVTILTRTPDAYTDPIHIESPKGDFTFHPKAIQSLSEVCDPFDVLILATKALPSIDAVSLVQPFMSKNTILMIIQNGIFIEDDLLASYDQNILRCLAFICVSRHSKTHIHHMDFGSLSVGGLNCTLNDLADHPLFQLFPQLDITVRLSPDIQQSIWEKLVWNAPFNPLSVVYNGATTAELLSNPTSLSKIRTIMQEVQLAATYANITITDEFIDEKIQQTQQMVPYKTSMCLDYESGSDIEVEAILGHLLQFGEDHSFDLPEIRSLYRDIQLLINKPK
ncbi:hypothetical protein DID73_00085 [Candidatus Marinamargulisbacteria bacterium SCGC AG-343-K17]|nr:hypothetical protein DID73_00085 [Candidatus Marinamargulisbacteria bacterium SCGC AG-343-K17]